MGGLSTLRRWFQANGCGEAFHTGLPELPAGSVYISDDLTRMHRFRGPASGFLTGRQFFEQWQQGVMRQLKTGVIKVYIAVYDNATLVPVENVAGCTITLETVAEVEDMGETGIINYRVALSSTPACPADLQINNACEFRHEYDLVWAKVE